MIIRGMGCIHLRLVLKDLTKRIAHNIAVGEAFLPGRINTSGVPKWSHEHVELSEVLSEKLYKEF